jgi:hypothetical protein
VLYGDVEEAICHHAYYYAIWKRYGCIPERFNWKLLAPDVKFYPLRNRFYESPFSAENFSDKFLSSNSGQISFQKQHIYMTSIGNNLGFQGIFKAYEVITAF